MNQSESASTAVKPPRLRSGDTVAVCAPAGPVQKSRLSSGLRKLARRFPIDCDELVYASAGFLAGDDERRVEHLNTCIRDPDIRAIAVARGGYGIMRILDRVDWDALRADPKVIIGFSDATVLLAAALRVAGVRGIHGPVVSQLVDLDESAAKWLCDLMENTEPPGEIATGLERTGRPSGAEQIEGRLLGGNLCMISHLVGTPYELQTDGAVLFLEEVDERPYAIDRYFTRLQLAGAFEGVTGVLLGDFTRCEPGEMGGPDAWDVAHERLSKFELGALRNFPIGHGKHNLALPYGAHCSVDFETRRVTVLDAAVS